jgi:GxxExxY protein
MREIRMSGSTRGEGAAPQGVAFSPTLPRNLNERKHHHRPNRGRPYRVQTTLGPGLLESVYEAALAWELGKRGLNVTRQQCIPVIYEKIHVHAGFFADLIVDDQVIVEIKSIDVIAPVHRRQLLTYLKLADKRLGLLINFNVALIKDGIIRITNGLKE